MPGVGKSTIGVLLAKATSRDFIDTDVFIQAKEGRLLQEIINLEGLEAFCRIEERHIISLACQACVIATGGSVVYEAEAMTHLRSSGVIVHLTLDFPLLKKRLTNLDSRGVVMVPGQTLAQLFAERQPLYEKYADLTFDCAEKSHEEIVVAIIQGMKNS